MEGLAIDLDKGKDKSQTADNRQISDKESEIAKTITQKDYQTAEEDDQKLPRRDRPEDLVLDINELGNDELVHTTDFDHRYHRSFPTDITDCFIRVICDQKSVALVNNSFHS